MSDQTDNSNLKRRTAIVNLWLALLLLAILSVFLVTAWQFGTGMRAREEGGGQPKSVWRTLQLPSGKRVEIPRKPERIVAANTGVADLLSGLIKPERFALVPSQVHDFAAAKEFWAAHKGLKSFEHYKAEPILAANPDLVISSALQDSATTAALQQRIPILALESFETFDGIRAAIRTLGEAVGEEGRAQEILNEMDERLKKVEQNVGANKRPRLLLYSNYSSGFTVGAGGSQDEILRRAGGINAAAELGLKGASAITFEQVLKLDPDVLVVCGDKGLDSPQVKLISAEPVLSGLRAVKEGRIAVIPPRLFDAVSQHVVEAVEILNGQLSSVCILKEPMEGPVQK